MYQITIKQCKIDGRSWTGKHRGENASDAIGASLKKHFGSGASLEIDRGLTNNSDTTRYGQVMRPSGNGYSDVAGRVRVDIEKV